MMKDVVIGAESAIAASGMPMPEAIGMVMGRISAVAAELLIKLDITDPKSPDPKNTTIQLCPSSMGRNWLASHL